MVAGGLAFFSLFSLLPAMAVMGLVFKAMVGSGAIESGLNDTDTLLPEGTPQLFAEFLLSVPDSLAAGLGLSVNLVVVFWTVQRSASGLITALNTVYDEDEHRSRTRREVVAVFIAVLGLAFLFLALLVALVLPLAAMSQPAYEFFATIRWPILAGLFLGALCILYAFAPSRARHDWRSILGGASVATVLWMIGTLLFALYMRVVGGWDRYYGSVTAAVVLMTWLFISAYIVMFGAELDAQIEAEAHPEKKHSATKDTLDRREEAGGRGAA